MQTHCQLDQFRILYQDQHIVAIHKPAGLLVHRSPIDKYETQFAVQLTREAVGQKVYPLHRLDKATSGILLFALDSDSARHISQQFEEHSLQKHYLAITRGWVNEAGSIDTPLKVKLDKIADKNADPNKPPQAAETHYQCLAHATLPHTIGQFDTQRYSLVKLLPKTGRKHQLRRHLKQLSHPIIGDVNHGDRHHNHFFNQHFNQHRLYLAATDLLFTHPATHQRIQLSAPLENSFQTTLTRLFPNHPLAKIVNEQTTAD